ncbi:hypothetical protein F5Y18DRAFT_431667 [Xylariaceae sp. FL1019]|nr:hypothetical protein F5Y18DRAFT_431667 [Xylariaceae sp. FL1019]
MAPTGGTPGAGRGQGDVPSTGAFNFADRSVAASNSTLNAWMGGRRRPTWLANAKPVQPTPRPIAPTLPPPAQPPAQSPQPDSPQPASLVMPRPKSSSIASTRSPLTSHEQSPPEPRPPHQPQDHPPPQPQLEPGPRESQPESQLRSPTTTAAPQPTPLTIPQAISVPHAATASTTASPSWPSSVLSAPRLSAISAETVLPSPAPSDEPSPCASAPHDSPGATSQRPPEAREGHPTVNAQFVFDEHASVQPMQPWQNRVSAPPPPTQPQPVTVSSSSPANMVLNTPPTPSAATFRDAAAPPRVSEDVSRIVPTKKRRVTWRPTIDFLNFLEAPTKFKQFLERVGGEEGLDDSCARPRAMLLRNALKEGDLFFVALHQLFCAWTLNQADMHRLCNERNMPDTSWLDTSLGLLGSIIKSNSMLKPDILQWFANFPIPVTHMRSQELYNSMLDQVIMFLFRMSSQWQLVNSRHVQAGYPLLMSELLNVFLLFSSCLQMIVFRASRRSIGVHDQPLGLQMDELFRSDQNNHRNPNDGTFSTQFEKKEYERYNKSLIERYKRLMAQGGQPQHSPSLPGSVPSPSNGQFIPSASSTPHPPGFPSPVINQVLQLNPLTPRTVLSPTSSGPSNPSTAPNAMYSPQFGITATPIVPSQSSPNIVLPFQPPNPNNQQAQFGGHGFRQTAAHAAQQLQTEQQRRMHVQRQQQQMQMAHQQYQAQQQQQQSHHPQLLQHLQQQQLLRPTQQNFQQVMPSNVPQQPQRATPSHGSRPLPRQATMATQMPPRPPSRTMPSFPSASTPVSTSPRPNPPNLHLPAQSPFVMPGGQPISPGLAPPVGPRHQKAQVTGQLIPPPGFRINLQDHPHTPYEKRSVHSALHQAHLRSPKRMPMFLPKKGPPERYYQAIKQIICGPMQISPQNDLYEFRFDVPVDDFKRLSFDTSGPDSTALVNLFLSGSTRVRVRCCNNRATDNFPEHLWVTSETCWPEHIFPTLNGRVLSVRRKQHHSKDLAVEASQYVMAGQNQLKIAVPAQVIRQNLKPYIAVEIVEVLNHSSILQMVLQSGTKPADETRQVIRTRLTGSSLAQDGDEGDELHMSTDGLSIDLADPFTKTIFDIPVRGRACTHLECFDLVTWLHTRPGKKSCDCKNSSTCPCPKEPSFVDKWKCPICDGDARPYSLVVDKYLGDVREDLERKNLLRTKSITAYANGTWKPNEAEDDSDFDSDGETPARTNPRNSKQPSKPPVEVIDLDDD